MVPDIGHGRKNADFGQGFYLSGDLDFTRRWIKIRKNQTAYINTYELSMDGLAVKALKRDRDWLRYIMDNRNGKADSLKGYDVITGPIANDTIYDLFGITSSGFLTVEQSMQILAAGQEYTQVVLKTEKAAEALRYVSSEIVAAEQAELFRESVKHEEEIYQNHVAELLQKWTDT